MTHPQIRLAPKRFFGDAIKFQNCCIQKYIVIFRYLNKYELEMHLHIPDRHDLHRTNHSRRQVFKFAAADA
jgi:hypothetical protein